MIGMAKGMVTTLRHMLRPAVTVQYPLVRRELPERSRTMFALPMKEDGTPACKACLVCEKNCPDNAIKLGTEKRADGPGRVLTHYSIDLGLCMYCGICVENCPSEGIAFCGDYERSTADKDTLVVVLYDEPYVAPVVEDGPEPAADDAEAPPAAGDAPAAPADVAPAHAPAEAGEGE
jgi:formate hydrogenlyase subunit 6/NADH:ubiquinone oxidoreductase subunit I